MRTFVVAALLALLAVPAVALGQPPAAGKPGTDCTTQLAAMGPTTFKQTYSPHGSARSAMAQCVARFTLIENQNVNNAAKTCRTEQAADPAAFMKKYGTNGNGHNAFGKCVSTIAAKKSATDVSATIGAAKACKTERSQMLPADFAKKYNATGAGENAFGKCVSAKSKQTEQQNP